MNRNYDAMKIPDLKTALKTRGLNTTGRKAELIDRLKNSDKDEERNRGIIQVYVKTLVGFCYDIKIQKTATIIELKEMIQQKIGIGPSKQKLYHVETNYNYDNLQKDVETHDDDILENIGVVEGSFFRLHQSLDRL